MSRQDSKEDNVLSFRRPAGSGEPAATDGRNISTEITELLTIYDRLIALLRETDNDGLDLLTEGLLVLSLRGKDALAAGDDKAGLAISRELRTELRQFPKNLRSLLPGIGPRLGESIQWKLGIEFGKY